MQTRSGKTKHRVYAVNLHDVRRFCHPRKLFPEALNWPITLDPRKLRCRSQHSDRKIALEKSVDNEKKGNRAVRLLKDGKRSLRGIVQATNVDNSIFLISVNDSATTATLHWKRC